MWRDAAIALALSIAQPLKPVAPVIPERTRQVRDHQCLSLRFKWKSCEKALG
jgi:hypothetical protein